MAHYLVTGGAGFIGSHIVEKLVSRENKIRVVDNFITGKKENILPFKDKIEFIEGDIRDRNICERVTEGIDFVLHQAALPSVPRSIEDPFLTTEINVIGTINLLYASANAKVKRLVFASSSSVYGDNPLLPMKEGREGIPLSPYASSKHAGEKYCQVFSKTYGLSTVCLRYFNVFGPRQDPTSQYAAAVPIFIRKVLRGTPPNIFGDGEQTRDFTYVANVVRANLLALEANDVSGEVINIACGKNISVNTLAEKIIKSLNTEIDPVYDKPRAGDVKESVADISKAKKLLDYMPTISFDAGLDKTIQWYKGKKNHERINKSVGR